MNTTTSLLRRSSKPSTIVLNSQEALTPPMAPRSRSSSVDSFDEEYFDKTYVPLSNLPTPPLSSHSNASTRLQSPEPLFLPGEYLDPELLGPAIHLTNLIPSSTSLTPASTPLIHALLTRASLPLETIALAVCILDSLNTRFALQWRKSCPLNTPTTNTYFRTGEVHIDSIHPELIPLSALILAVKFLDDAQQSTREYVNAWGQNMWSCEQVNYTQWCLMDNLGGRLLPLWKEELIIGALEDMERAARQSVKQAGQGRQDGRICLHGMSIGENEETQRVMSDGFAVLGLGEQLTPLETPALENVKGTGVVSEQTRKAFSKSGSGEESFELKDMAKGLEKFPAYVDPSRGPF